MQSLSTFELIPLHVFLFLTAWHCRNAEWMQAVLMCIVVVYEFLCGWRVLNCSSSQQVILIISDTAAHPFTFASGRKPSLCSAVTHHTVHTFKTRRYWSTNSFGQLKPCLITFLVVVVFNFAFFIIKAVCFDYN